MKKELPKNIATKMDSWRSGFVPMPLEYIIWHEDLAATVLEQLKNDHGIIVHSTQMLDDGWLDGMKSLHAVIETKSGKLMKLKYSDSNQGFMQVYQSGGAGSIHPKDLQ